MGGRCIGVPARNRGVNPIVISQRNDHDWAIALASESNGHACFDIAKDKQYYRMNLTCNRL